MRFGLFTSFFDVVFGQITAVLNGNALFFAGSLVFGSHIQDTVGVEVKGNFDLRNASRGRSNTVQYEAAKALVVGRHLALTLQYMNFYLVLIVCSRTKGLALASWNGSVAVNQLGTDTAHSFDAQRKWCYVEQKNVFDVTCQHATLDCGTYGYNFVRINTLHWFLAKDLLDLFLDCWHASHTTDQYNGVNFTGFQAGIFQGLFARFCCTVNKIANETFEFCSVHLELKVHRTICGCS